MTILALEFSSPQRSVAVLRSGDAQAVTETIETGERGTNAFGMIEKVLAQVKIEREEIEAIAVGLGPGSYTGIRAAIAIAQGWQLVRKIKLIGISSVEAIAAQAQSEKIFGRVNVVVDAQRNEFYLASYEISEKRRTNVEPLKILPLAEVQSRADKNEILAGPETTKWFPQGRIIFPCATTLVQITVGRADFVSGERLEPIYLRATNFVKMPPNQIKVV